MIKQVNKSYGQKPAAAANARATAQAGAGTGAATDVPPHAFTLKSEGPDGKLVTMTRLWERTSKSGAIYFNGSIKDEAGNKIKVVLYPNDGNGPVRS